MDNSVYPKLKKLRWRWDGEAGEHITFLNPANGAINVLNPIAASIFSLSDGQHSVEQIVDSLMETFSAPSREQVRNDVQNFLDFMGKQRLILLLDGP